MVGGADPEASAAYRWECVGAWSGCAIGCKGHVCGHPKRHAIAMHLNGISCVGSTFVGSAYITASQPLAVARSQCNGDAQLMESSRDGGTAGGTAAAVYVRYPRISAGG